jgi:hypothetical protein
MHTLNISDTVEMLTQIFARDEKHTVILLGPPGAGKTSAVAHAAKVNDREILNLALPTCEAVDLRGIPTVQNGRTVWASPLPKEGRGVLLLDELTSAPKDVQVAAHHIVWQEKGSDMGLGDGWQVVLTGNNARDKSVYQAIGAPLRNRMTIIQVEPDVKGWENWAMEKGISADIIGFLRFRPDLLSQAVIPVDGAFASPRSWESCNYILGLKVSANIERSMLEGTIGEGPSTEFAAYLALSRALPSIQHIIDNQDTAEVPVDPATRYALTTNLSQYSRQTQESLMVFMARMPSEFALLYIRDIREKLDVAKCPEIRKWIKSHKALFAS